jgi:hypothetical protein
VALASASVERLRAIVLNRKSRDTDVIAAARALADLERGDVAALPHSLAQAQRLSQAQVVALLSLPQLARYLPAMPEPA